MKRMLALVMLFVSGFACVEADVNLKAHEKRINAYHDRMKKEGKEPSKEVVAVLHGMKKGNYKYDLETARKVMREVHAKRMPAAPKNLK
jgi:hypothetical protein